VAIKDDVSESNEHSKSAETKSDSGGQTHWLREHRMYDPGGMSDAEAHATIDVIRTWLEEASSHVENGSARAQLAKNTLTRIAGLLLGFEADDQRREREVWDDIQAFALIAAHSPGLSQEGVLKPHQEVNGRPRVCAPCKVIVEYALTRSRASAEKLAMQHKKLHGAVVDARANKEQKAYAILEQILTGKEHLAEPNNLWRCHRARYAAYLKRQQL